MTIPRNTNPPAPIEETGTFQPAPASAVAAASGIGANASLHTLTLPNAGNPAVERFTLPGYDILEELGRGGMGVVYKALQTGLHRLVAVKMILSGVHASASDRSRFRTEAKAIARLHHPNIVQVHEVGEHDGKPYLTLEFCGGGSLEKQLKGTPLPAHAAAKLIETLARAVHAAHEQRIVHRDLKPANILLSVVCSPSSVAGTEGQRTTNNEQLTIPKIADFGLAKRLDEASQTYSGTVMGTPSYMAPEQAASNMKEIGPAADIYALGAILYECLTGRPPFKGPTALDTILQVIADDPVPPTQLQSRTPRDLETVCLKCLQKEPKRRYATALDFAEDLRRFQAGEPIAARPFGLAERGWRWIRRNPLVAGLNAAIALLLLLAGVVGTLVAVQQSNLRETAQKNELAARAAQDQAAKQTLSAYETLARSYRDQAQVLWTSGVPQRQTNALTLLQRSDQLRPSMEELLVQLDDRAGDWRERHDRFWFDHRAALNSEAMRWLQNTSLQRLDPPLRFQPPANADTQSRQTGAFAVSPDGKWLARFQAATPAEQTPEVALWNLERRVQIATLPLALTFKPEDDAEALKRQYQVSVDSVRLAFSPDSKRLLVLRREIQREEGKPGADQFALVLESLPLAAGGERDKPVVLQLKNEQMRTPRRFFWQAERDRVLVLPERMSVSPVNSWVPPPVVLLHIPPGGGIVPLAVGVGVLASPPVAVVLHIPSGGGNVPLAVGVGVLALPTMTAKPESPVNPPVDQLTVFVCDANDGRLLATLNPANFAPLGVLAEGRQLYGLGWREKPDLAEPFTLKIVDSNTGQLLKEVPLPTTQSPAFAGVLGGQVGGFGGVPGGLGGIGGVPGGIGGVPGGIGGIGGQIGGVPGGIAGFGGIGGGGIGGFGGGIGGIGGGASNYNHDSLIVSPDGRWWAESAPSYQNNVRVTLGDMETGQEKATRYLPAIMLDFGMTSLAFRPDSRALAAAFSPRLHVLSVPAMNLLESQPLSPGWDADEGTPAGPGMPGWVMGPGGTVVQAGGWHPYDVEFLPDGARVVADLRMPRRRRDQGDRKPNEPVPVPKQGETALMEQVVQFWDLSLAQVTPPRAIGRVGQLTGLALDARSTRLYFSGEANAETVGAGAWNLEPTARSSTAPSLNSDRAGQLALAKAALVWKVAITQRIFDDLDDTDAHGLFDKSGRVAFDWKQSLHPFAPQPGMPGAGADHSNLDVLDAVTGRVRQTIPSIANNLVASSPDRRHLAFAPGFTGGNVVDLNIVLALGTGHGAPPFLTGMNNLLAAHLVGASDLLIFDAVENRWLLPFRGEEWQALTATTFSADGRYVIATNNVTVSIGRLTDGMKICTYPVGTYLSVASAATGLAGTTATACSVRFDDRSETAFIATPEPAVGNKPAYLAGHIVELATGRERAQFDLGSNQQQTADAMNGMAAPQPGADSVAGQPEMSPDGKRVAVLRTGNAPQNQAYYRVCLWSEGDKAAKPLSAFSWYSDVPTYEFNADGSRLVVWGTLDKAFNLQERMPWQTVCLTAWTIGLPSAGLAATATGLANLNLLPDAAILTTPEQANKYSLELWDLSGAPRLLASSRDKPGVVSRYDICDKRRDGTVTVSLTSEDADASKARCEVWDMRTGRVLAEHAGVTTVETVNSTHTYVLGTLTEAGPLQPGVNAVGLINGFVLNNVVVDLSGKQKLLKMTGAPCVVSAQAFSPDGRFLLATRDFTAKGVVLWNLLDQKSLELPIDRADVFCFSSDGGRLATFEAGKNEGIKVWDTTTGKPVQTVSPEAGNRIPGGPPGNCTGLRFSADGKILGLTVNGQRRLANVATGKVYKVMTRYEHLTTVSSIAVHDEAAGGLVATASEDRTIGLWRAADGLYLGMLEGYAAPVHSLAFDRTGQRLLTRDGRGALVMWKLERGESEGQPVVTATVAWQTAEPGQGSALAWSSDGSRIATDGLKGVVRLWTAETGEPAGTMDAPEATANLTSLAFSPDGKTVVGGGTDGVVRLWEKAHGKLMRSWPTDQGEIRAVAVHPREDLIITAGADVRLWKGQQLMLKLDRHTRPVNHVCWSADGKTVVTAGEDGTVVVWNLEEMKAGLETLGLGW